MRAHDFYIDSFKLPITPEDIEVNYKGKNKAIDLLNGDELNVLNKPSLTTFKFDFFLPRDYAPIVGEYIEPFTVAHGVEKMMKEKKIIPFIIIRHDRGLKNSIIKKATVEDFSYEESVENAPGLMASITLKVYIPLKTKVLTAKSDGEKTTLSEVNTADREAKASVKVRENEPINVAIRRGGGNIKNYKRIKDKNKITSVIADYTGKTLELN
ncbi:hypothetical protein [Fenollaria timonensis]|uniref:hypothetical protein n=1 Tax=Fenollaria timonensis TaxID=1723384 RepID=UPI0026EDB03D|nr:hypothetical protein [Fenollaria timonensis]